MRLVADLLDICSPDDEDESEHARSRGDMRQAFFNREDLNASRLKYALALWCAVRQLHLSSDMKLISRVDLLLIKRNLRTMRLLH
jgi:hypothetical protein